MEMRASSGCPFRSKSRDSELLFFFLGLTPYERLVTQLGLASTLTEYKVPKDDIPVIVAKVVGSKEGDAFQKVVKLLNGLY